MVFGFWAIGNRQIFENFVQGRENKNDPVITGHKTLAIDLDQRLPLLLLFLFYNVLAKMISRRMIKVVSEDEDHVDENLGCYIDKLGPFNRMSWYADEMMLENAFKKGTVSPEWREDLKARHEKTKTIETIRTTPNYEITSNPLYAE